MMKRRDFLGFSLTASCSLLMPRALRGAEGHARKPDILFITADDLNCDSVGVFGAKVPGITPNLDRLAGEGIRFVHAHVQVANCVPSRNVMQTGRYPHTSGVEGFYKVQPDFPILPDILKANGYVIGIKNKVGHSTPYSPYPWDLVVDRTAERGAARSPASFREFVAEGIALAEKQGKSFYLIANITDPHKPFYGEAQSKTAGYDAFPPSKVFRDEDIPVPGFLPDHPEIRHEVRQYYDSVRRLDDSVGQILEALRESGRADNTVVMFLSDHGMPFPFAKTNLYRHSTRTPWIVRWPGQTRPGSADERHMISAIDFMPTILDIVGLPQPEGLQGRSFKPLLLGEPQDGRGFVVTEYNENSAGHRHPMRAVETPRYGYIFNPWSNGTRRFRTATQGTTTYRVMQQLAQDDPAIAARVRQFDYRTVEELYDYGQDPDALRNLVDDPAHAETLAEHRRLLEAWMVQTGDPCLAAFRQRGDAAALDEFVNRQQEESDARRQTKRGQGAGKKEKGLVTVAPPAMIERGKTVAVTVAHALRPEHGEQQLHVTLRLPDGARIERKVLAIKGKGEVTVRFDVPADTPETVVFAAFVGKDFPSCLEHVLSDPVTVK